MVIYILIYLVWRFANIEVKEDIEEHGVVGLSHKRYEVHVRRNRTTT